MKKYTLLVYKNSNQFTIINFNTAAEANAQVKDLTNIYKIKLFELNGNKDGKNLLKEYIINEKILKVYNDEKNKGILKSLLHLLMVI